MLRGHMEEEEGRAEQECLPPQPTPYPWLLYFNDNEENQTFCSISDPTITYPRSIPELMGAAVKVWTIQHGWCLLENMIKSNSKHHIHNLFLWSPSNFKKIELPQLKLSNNITIGYSIFSSSPTTTDQVCSIFLFSVSSTLIFYCQLGDDQWTEVDYREDLLSDPDFRKETFITNPVYCNGNLYAESMGNNVLVVIQKPELGGLQIKSTGVPLPAWRATIPMIGLYHTAFWFGSNHQLFRILISLALDKVIGVSVQCYDFSLRTWEKGESIKDKVFFISISDSKSKDVCSRSRFVCQTINSDTEGGRVYLALKDNDFVYIYNIEDNSLMISQHFSNLPKNRSCSLWFMPEPTDVRLSDMLKKEIIRECGAIHLKEMRGRATNFNSYAFTLDVVESIAKRLNVFDYLHLRATSKFFYLGALPLAQIQWRSRFDDLSLFPLLVLSNKDKVFTFVHPKQGLKYKYTITFPPQITTGGEIICYSKDGWLLLASRDSSFFFNPFTKQVLPLTDGIHDTIKSSQCVGFSHPPTSSECAIIECMGKIAFLTFFGGERTPFDYHEDLYRFPLYNMSPLFFNGSFYYLSIEGKLGVIQARRLVGQHHEAALDWKELQELQPPCTNFFNSFLVECDGNLLSVFEGEDNFQKWVQVFKLNEPTMNWSKVENLESHMLFVNGNASFSKVATIPGMENKIYFPRLYGQNIVFYSLETNNYHTSENEVLNFHHVREQLNSSWIEPRWH